MDRFAVAELTLIDDTTSICVRPANATAGDPIACRQWDLGAPEVRITSTPRPGADGVTEGAGYLGSRTVTMDLLIRGDGAGNTAGHDPYWYVQQLTGMCHPSRRPVLKIQRYHSGIPGTAWYLGLRGNPWSLPFERASAAMLNLQLTFIAPTGMFESSLHTVSSGDQVPVAATDWHFPAAFPHGFGPTNGLPRIVCPVAGTGPVNPILYASGPVTNPYLRDDLGNKFRFDGLTLADGQTVQIDMGAGTVLVADPETGWSDTSADVFHTVDFAVSDFWQWPVGTRTVQSLVGPGTFAAQWRDRQLSI